jgi:1-deoxy-D-xylulose-5-phosphate synthase
VTGDADPAAIRAISGPADLMGLSASELVALAEEIRGFLIEKVSRTGGHLGPNLGAVELTIALHRVFRSPHDVLLFDTGHQAYVHKILTGRAAEFGTLRQAGGLSGYPSRSESEHDVIENSHASTALSYADGLAKAFALRKNDRRVVAVLGDGALTGGMCWEALNNIGAAPDRPMVVVLNDNGRSYAPTVGGIASHLTELRFSGERNIFEDIGISYIGPVDGHDILALEHALNQATRLNRPVVLHCVTHKGKGFEAAEHDEADRLHAVGPAGGAERPTWTSVFADEIAAIGAERPDVVCVTAAMAEPAGLATFAHRFPNRIFDVGIAEQHAVTSAVGLAIGGMHPVVAIYATFLSRAVDQLLMDVALHRLPVTFVLDRAGVTGPDGPSHHGMWDASILPVVPGLRLACPRDPVRLRELLREAVEVTDGPTVVRYPRSGAGPDIPALRRTGHCDVLKEDPAAEVLLVAVGPLTEACLAAADELAGHDVPVTVVDPRWTAPLDPALLKLAGTHRLVVAVEDTTTPGALGGRLAQALAAIGSDTCAATFALPPRFLPHASRTEILRAHGLDAAGITTTVLKRLEALS